MGKKLEQIFFQRRRRNGQQIYEKILNINNVSKLQAKTPIKHHFTPVRMATTKNNNNKNKEKRKKHKVWSAGEDGKKLEPWHTFGGNVK